MGMFGELEGVSIVQIYSAYLTRRANIFCLGNASLAPEWPRKNAIKETRD